MADSSFGRIHELSLIESQVKTKVLTARHHLGNLKYLIKHHDERPVEEFLGDAASLIEQVERQLIWIAGD